MKATAHQPTITPKTTQSSRMSGVLQRCGCGGKAGVDGECAECRARRLSMQRYAASANTAPEAPPIVHDVLRASGQPLDAATSDFMQSRFGHDFSRVRVHTDARAAESADAVNALAYTVGDNIAFAAGRYAPNTDTGRRLLAHELTHVVQQSSGHAGLATHPNGITIDSSSAFEAEAHHNADLIAGDGPLAVHAVSQAPAIMREDGDGGGGGTGGSGSGGTQQPSVNTTGCTGTKPSIIDNARRAAAVRTQIAMFRVRGAVPAGPRPDDDTSGASQRHARNVARTIFGEDMNMEQVGDILSSMVTRLTSPGLSVTCAPASDPECGTRAGYVRGFRPPIFLCPAFFAAGTSAEQQIRTMIHEAAHLVGIGNTQTLGESYCVFFDCSSSCGGFHSADSWAHFVHCLSGQTPDTPTAIQGRPGGGGGGGSGGTP